MDTITNITQKHFSTYYNIKVAEKMALLVESIVLSLSVILVASDKYYNGNFDTRPLDNLKESTDAGFIDCCKFSNRQLFYFLHPYINKLFLMILLKLLMYH